MKKVEVTERGDKRPLSHGLMENPPSQQAKRDNIQSKTDAYLAKGGCIEQIENGVMTAETKGSTALRINHEKVAVGFIAKQNA